MSEEIADAIETLRDQNNRLRAALTVLRPYLASLQKLVVVLNQPREDGEVMAALLSCLESARQVLDAAQATLLVLDDDCDELVAVLSVGTGDSAAWSSNSASAGLTGWVLQHEEALITNGAPADERFDSHADQLPGGATSSLLAVPVRGRERTMGVLRIVNKGGQAGFSQDDQTLIGLAARLSGEVLIRMALRHAVDDGG